MIYFKDLFVFVNIIHFFIFITGEIDFIMTILVTGTAGFIGLTVSV